MDLRPNEKVAIRCSIRSTYFVLFRDQFYFETSSVSRPVLSRDQVLDFNDHGRHGVGHGWVLVYDAESNIERCFERYCLVVLELRGSSCGAHVQIELDCSQYIEIRKGIWHVESRAVDSVSK